jgi:phospholipid-binding lipoprotein MlaA
MEISYLTKAQSLAAAVVLLFPLAGCAMPPPDDDPEALAEFEAENDPLEPLNRIVFSANDHLYRNGLRPLIDFYRAVVPEPGRRALGNVLGNLKLPKVLVNDLAQGNLPSAGETLARLALNSSFGVGGLADIASPLGFPAHQADAGQSLGWWGLGEGPYLVLPLFGPSDARDAVGMAADSFADPLDLTLSAHSLAWAAALHSAAGVLDMGDRNLDALDDVRRSSIDFYSALRSLYRQRRAGLVAEARSRGVFEAP